MVLNKQNPEQAKVCSPDVQDNDFAVHPTHCPKDLELHLFMVTVAKAALEIYIPPGENMVQHSTSPLLVPLSLGEESYQQCNPEDSLMPCCAVPPVDNQLIEFPHEDHSLCT